MLRIRQALIALIAAGVVFAGVQLPAATAPAAYAAPIFEIPAKHNAQKKAAKKAAKKAQIKAKKKAAKRAAKLAKIKQAQAIKKAKSVRVPKVRKGRVCPTKNFWVGAGFGAPRGKRSHMGIDLGGKRGTPIFAVEAGRIDRTKKQSNGSLQIVLKGKSGSKFYYGHMDRVLIRSGQPVRRGQVIGLMGDTGSPGAVHLHFEYWKSGRESAAIDPRKFIRQICRQ